MKAAGLWFRMLMIGWSPTSCPLGTSRTLSGCLSVSCCLSHSSVCSTHGYPRCQMTLKLVRLYIGIAIVWSEFCFVSFLTENGCIYIWLPSREKGHSSQNFTNSFFSQWFGLSNFFWEGTNIQRYGIMQWIAVSTFVKTFLTKHDLRNKHDTYNSTISIVFYLSYS